MVPFTVQVTRGLLRDERSRRKTMGFSLVVAVVMVVTGLILILLATERTRDIIDI